MAKKSASLVRRPRRRPRTEMATGTISTTNSCLASHRKKPPRCCESAYLSGIVLTVSVASISRQPIKSVRQVVTAGV